MNGEILFLFAAVFVLGVGIGWLVAMRSFVAGFTRKNDESSTIHKPPLDVDAVKLQMNKLLNLTYWKGYTDAITKKESKSYLIATRRNKRLLYQLLGIEEE